MKQVKIITDSCSDLDAALREQYGIDYVKMNVVMRGEEKPANLDWELYSPKEFYDIMRGGERITTTQVPASEFIEVFEKYASEGCDIVYIACSAVLSGSVNTGIVVAKDVMKKYPDANIICIDSKNSCMGEGMIAIEAAKLAAEGKSAAEIAAAVDDMKLSVNQFAAVEKLDYLKRAGRVKASSAFFGNLFGVKPIIISDANGQNVAVAKVKGRSASIRECVNMLKEIIIEPEKQTLFVGHADCVEAAEELKALAEQELKPADVHMGYIGPIIGASVGPGTIVIYGVGKKVDIQG